MGFRQRFTPNVSPPSYAKDTPRQHCETRALPISIFTTLTFIALFSTALAPVTKLSSPHHSPPPPRTSLLLLLVPLSSSTPHLSLPPYYTTLRSLPLYSCTLLPFSSSLPFSLHIIFPFLPICALKFALSEDFPRPKLVSQPIINYSNNQSLPSFNMDMLVYFIALSVSLFPPLVLDSRDFPL